MCLSKKQLSINSKVTLWVELRFPPLSSVLHLSRLPQHSISRALSLPGLWDSPPVLLLHSLFLGRKSFICSVDTAVVLISEIQFTFSTQLQLFVCKLPEVFSILLYHFVTCWIVLRNSSLPVFHLFVSVSWRCIAHQTASARCHWWDAGKAWAQQKKAGGGTLRYMNCIYQLMLSGKSAASNYSLSFGAVSPNIHSAARSDTTDFYKFVYH